MTDQDQDLRAKANQAIAAASDQAGAFAAELAAEGELLSRALEIVGPALPTIVGLQGPGRRGCRVSAGLLLLEDGTFFDESIGQIATPEEAAAIASPEEILARIATALGKQPAGRARSTARAREREHVIRAILTLLEVAP